LNWPEAVNLKRKKHGRATKSSNPKLERVDNAVVFRCNAGVKKFDSRLYTGVKNGRDLAFIDKA
jgi:hypothetical protein